LLLLLLLLLLVLHCEKLLQLLVLVQGGVRGDQALVVGLVGEVDGRILRAQARCIPELAWREPVLLLLRLLLLLWLKLLVKLLM